MKDQGSQSYDGEGYIKSEDGYMILRAFIGTSVSFVVLEFCLVPSWCHRMHGALSQTYDNEFVLVKRQFRAVFTIL